MSPSLLLLVLPSIGAGLGGGEELDRRGAEVEDEQRRRRVRERRRIAAEKTETRVGEWKTSSIQIYHKIGAHLASRERVINVFVHILPRS
jgi:hypothetical protein